MTDHTPEPWDKLKEIEGRLNAGEDDILGNDRAALIEQVRTLLDLCAIYTEDLKRAEACMVACAGIPTEQLGDVKALVESVTGHESPQLWRIEWLASLLQSYEEGGLDQLAAERKEDPDAFLTLLIELQELVSLTRAALAPFRKD